MSYAPKAKAALLDSIRQSDNARPCNCDQATALNLTCAAQGKKLAAVERILCDLVSAPSLRVAEFNDPTLERIRLAMLGRPW